MWSRWRWRMPRGWVGASVAALAIVAVAGGMVSRPDPWDQAVVIPVIGQRPETVRFEQGLWIARQRDGEFYAFLNVDPHGHHPTAWDVQKGIFFASFSSGGFGEGYAIDGRCIVGPCPVGGGLYRVASKLDGNRLLALPSDVVAGGGTTEPAWLFDLRQQGLDARRQLAHDLGQDPKPATPSAPSARG